MMMTMVTLITANITPTINPISEELLTEIEDEVAIVEVDTTMPLVVVLMCIPYTGYTN